MKTYDKPKLDDYRDEDGYYDFELYDIDLAIWEQDNEPPILKERWCSEVDEVQSSLDSMQPLLSHLLASLLR